MDSSLSGSNTSLVDVSNSLAKCVEQVKRVTVAVNARENLPSSGVHWQQGVVVTAAHTVKRDEDLAVVLPDGQTAMATLLGLDPGTDLAALRVDTPELPVAQSGDSSALKLGEIVLAVGYRGGMGHFASWGIVGGLGGPWQTWRGIRIERFIRPDLSLHPGFSGSALVNTLGLVVGINTTGLSRRTPLAIPATTVKRVIEELVKKGRISRGFLGVGLQPVYLPDSLREKLNLASLDGVILLGVEPDGPADQAGFLIGDILLELDGKTIAKISDVQNILAPEYIGKKVKAVLVRAGNRTECSITIGERPTKQA